MKIKVVSVQKALNIIKKHFKTRLKLSNYSDDDFIDLLPDTVFSQEVEVVRLFEEDNDTYYVIKDPVCPYNENGDWAIHALYVESMIE